MAKKPTEPSEEDLKWALDQMFDTEQWGFRRRDTGITARPRPDSHADKAKKSKSNGPRKKD